jgi:hypothetical protein
LPSIPKEYGLEQNYPNPFNPSTTIPYTVRDRSKVKLQIVNTLGQRIAKLVDDEKEAGYYEAVWQTNAASGIYFYCIEATALNNPSDRFVAVKKMLLLR